MYVVFWIFDNLSLVYPTVHVVDFISCWSHMTERVRIKWKIDFVFSVKMHSCQNSYPAQRGLSAAVAAGKHGYLAHLLGANICLCRAIHWRVRSSRLTHTPCWSNSLQWWGGLELESLINQHNRLCRLHTFLEAKNDLRKLCVVVPPCSTSAGCY